MNKTGINVLRFSDGDVLKRMNTVIEKISSNPSLTKRGTKRSAEIFIIEPLDYKKCQNS